MPTNIILHTEHGYVLIGILVMHLQCAIAGFSIGSARRKYKVPYPDMGNGIHAKKLNDQDWEKFNNYQRVHGNYLEDIGLVTFVALVSGAFSPLWTAGLLLAYIIGRYLYGWGYINSGSGGRYAGVLVLDLAKVAMIGITGYHSLKVSAFI